MEYEDVEGVEEFKKSLLCVRVIVKGVNVQKKKKKTSKKLKGHPSFYYYKPKLGCFGD